MALDPIIQAIVDQSKAAGVFVHGLLGLPQGVRVVELKQVLCAVVARPLR